MKKANGLFPAETALHQNDLPGEQEGDAVRGCNTVGIRAGRDTGIVVRLMGGQVDDGSKREPGWNIGVTSCLAASSDGTEDIKYLALGYEGARSQALGYGSID